MTATFIEVLFEGGSLDDAGMHRDAVEDPLGDALIAAGLGDVTGGGGGIRGGNIDIEIEDEDRFEEALRLIRRVLRRVKAPANTVIRRHTHIDYPLTE